MNRIAGRAWVLLVLVLVLVGGLLFFLGEYAAGAADWVVFSGSPHLYSNGKIATVMTDRDGVLLADLSGKQTFAPDSGVRQAAVHWTGDRTGNVNMPFMTYYRQQMSGFNLADGVYVYGEGGCRTELTLSAAVEKAALEALGDYHGTLAVCNYKTGEIICAVSAPSFDPENPPEITEDTAEQFEGIYVNRFIQSAYIPGSIFKIVTTAAALETISDIQERTFTCQRVYKMEGGEVTCELWHGEQTLEQAFANSCNCAFAQVAELVGADKLAQYVEQFQVTAPVSFDGITTAAGNYDITGAAPVNVSWSGIGQYTDLINPCRFLTFVGAIANGGSGPEPYLVSQITVGEKTTYSARTKSSDRLMSRSTAQTLQSFLRNNVESVYGDSNFPGITVCAKSGTGQVGGDKAPNAMFAGFVADEEYPFAFIVAIEEGGYGSHTCVPIISMVLAACVEAMK